MAERTCSVDGCPVTPKRLVRGMCLPHYRRWARHGDPLGGRSGVGRTEMERWWDKVAQRGPDDCWLWQGSVSSNGYGSFKTSNGAASAHRFGWERLNGRELPAHLCVCHRC